MNTLFTFFLLVTIYMIGIITAPENAKDKLHFFNSFNFLFTPITKADACVKNVWQPTGSNYLIYNYKPPEETVWLPLFSSNKKSTKPI